MKKNYQPKKNLGKLKKFLKDNYKREIQEALKGADMVFITCGLGGGTGTGASPIIAEAAKSKGSLMFAVVIPSLNNLSTFVIPANAWIHDCCIQPTLWIPTFVGMTRLFNV